MLAAGTTIEKWVVVRPLGSGGMGHVFLCHDQMNARIRAAVKVFHTQSEEQRARFLREVEALHRLNHPTIVRLVGWGEADGRLFLAMEYVEGEELLAVLRRGPMEPVQALRLFARLADGLTHAHKHGITHRDIKPSNILITPSGEARLVDFGIAAHEEQNRLTEANLVAGTISYLPPEALQVNHSPALPPMDVFALAQCLAETLLGRELFPTAGRTRDQYFAQVLQARREMTHVDLGEDAPRSIRDLIRINTAADPRQRLSMIHLRDRLASLVVTVRGQDLLADDIETKWMAFDIPQKPRPLPISDPTPVPLPPPAPISVFSPGPRPGGGEVKPPLPSTTAGPSTLSVPWWGVGLVGGVGLFLLGLAGVVVYSLADYVLSPSPPPLPGDAITEVSPVPVEPVEPTPAQPGQDTGVEAPPEGETEAPPENPPQPPPPPERRSTSRTKSASTVTAETESPPPPPPPAKPPSLCVFYPVGGGTDVNIAVSGAGGTGFSLSPGSYRCAQLTEGSYVVEAKARRRGESILSVTLAPGSDQHVRVVLDPDEDRKDSLRLQKAPTSSSNLSGLSRR